MVILRARERDYIVLLKIMILEYVDCGPTKRCIGGFVATLVPLSDFSPLRRFREQLYRTSSCCIWI